MGQLWLGQRYAHSTEPTGSDHHEMFGFRKSIIPTKNIFQVGLHMSGACKLDYPWNGCDKNSTGFCYAKEEMKAGHAFSTYHSFHERVMGHDVKEIDMATEGVLHHTMFHRSFVIISNETDLSSKNDYAAKYFPRTLEALRKRRLDILIETPERATKSIPIANSWTDYDLVYHSRGTLGSLFPAYGIFLPSKF